FRRPVHREGRRGAAGDHLADRIEEFGPHEGLVFGRPVPTLPGCELLVLQLRIRGHAARRVTRRELEHRQVERVESGEGDELESVAQLPQFALELREARRIQFFPPVERGGAVVREEFPRVVRMDRVRKFARFLQVWRGGLAPQYVGVWRVRETASDRRAEAAFELEESIRGALA